MSDKPTRAMKDVLRLLAQGGWVMDRYGKNECQAIMLRRRGEDKVVSAKTVSRLLDANFITTACNGVTDYHITPQGKAAVNTTPERND